MENTVQSRYVSVSVFVVVTLLLWISPAIAFDNDPAFSRLCTPVANAPTEAPCGTNPTGDQPKFAGLTREYALALSPGLMAPAETMGINGFQFDLQFSVTTINNDRSYWIDGIQDETPPGSLVVSRVGVRKGLPGSLEIGMTGSYLIESELWMFTVLGKWALHEGMTTVPLDLAVRGTYNTLVGSTEVDLKTVGLDVIVSKSFGVAGVVNVSPYVAYSPLWIYAQSNVIDSTPGSIDGSDGDFVFADEDQMVHRTTLGVRFIMGLFNLTPEAALASSQQTYSVNLGADF